MVPPMTGPGMTIGTAIANAITTRGVMAITTVIGTATGGTTGTTIAAAVGVGQVDTTEGGSATMIIAAEEVPVVPTKSAAGITGTGAKTDDGATMTAAVVMTTTTAVMVQGVLAPTKGSFTTDAGKSTVGRRQRRNQCGSKEEDVTSYCTLNRKRRKVMLPLLNRKRLQLILLSQMHCLLNSIRSPVSSSAKKQKHSRSLLPSLPHRFAVLIKSRTKARWTLPSKQFARARRRRKRHSVERRRKRFCRRHQPWIG
mmetsp:Transcript_28737/g.84749  ORF Transcript_28737/g.84749 Transcript_28737/m.84749 type:complete len:255 (-) Transcript_28737:2335-3099(-)